MDSDLTAALGAVGSGLIMFSAMIVLSCAAVLFCYTLFGSSPVSSIITKAPHDKLIDLCLNFLWNNTNTTTSIAGSLVFNCVAFLHTSHITFSNQSMFTEPEIEWLDKLTSKALMYNSTLKRKELRRLTEQEWNNTKTAINRLKETKINGSERTKYDVISVVHRENATLYHGGPAFLGWHRMYLKLLETALQEEIPGVTIPYWDSSLESNMDLPQESELWTEKFLGNGQGNVVTGPFANWITSDGVNLRRDAGCISRLFTLEGIRAIMNQTNNSAVTFPPKSREEDYTIESPHNGVHAWVGGHMQNVPIAPADPVFFFHHAFVDYVWEKFRQQLPIEEVEIYPEKVDIQQGNASMYFFDMLTNAEGYTLQAYYEDTPSCDESNKDCDSKHLSCILKNNTEFVCVPKRKENSDGQESSIICPNRLRDDNSTRPIQNRFTIDSVDDIDQWAFIPIRVVYKRPTDTHYSNRVVQNGSVIDNLDIFDPSGSQRFEEKLASGSPLTFKSCQKSSFGTGTVYVTSVGINYDGLFQEYALTDQRLPLSESVTFIAVKAPTSEDSLSYLVAFDDCGRYCFARCLVAGSEPSVYEPCIGAINVTSDLPKMYGNTFLESFQTVWDMNFTAVPRLHYEQIFLTFYCDPGQTEPDDFSDLIDVTTETVTFPSSTTKQECSDCTSDRSTDSTSQGPSRATRRQTMRTAGQSSPTQSPTHILPAGSRSSVGRNQAMTAFLVSISFLLRC